MESRLEGTMLRTLVLMTLENVRVAQTTLPSSRTAALNFAFQCTNDELPMQCIYVTLYCPTSTLGIRQVLGRLFALLLDSKGPGKARLAHDSTTHRPFAYGFGAATTHLDGAARAGAQES